MPKQTRKSKGGGRGFGDATRESNHSLRKESCSDSQVYYVPNGDYSLWLGDRLIADVVGVP